MKLRGITAPDGKPIRFGKLPLPKEIRGATIARERGYTIALNSRRCGIAQRLTLGHELAHVFLGHYERERKRESVKAQEREARRCALKFSMLYFLRLI